MNIKSYICHVGHCADLSKLFAMKHAEQAADYL
jgi:hypothetical protein